MSTKPGLHGMYLKGFERCSSNLLEGAASWLCVVGAQLLFCSRSARHERKVVMTSRVYGFFNKELAYLGCA